MLDRVDFSNWFNIICPLKNNVTINIYNWFLSISKLSIFKFLTSMAAYVLLEFIENALIRWNTINYNNLFSQ